MEIRDLRCALAARDTGSFAQAASALYVSRQAVSQTVRRLEDEIGVRMFDVAGGNRLEATPEGAVFLAQARPVVEAFDELARAYPSMRECEAGTLSLALATGAALSLPDTFFSDFSEANPRLVQEIEEGNTDGALASLDAGRADVALVGSCPSLLDPTRFERALLVATRLWLAVPRGNPLATRPSLTLEDLDGQQLVTAGKANHLHRFVIDACERAGIHVGVPATSSNPDMLVSLARKHGALFFTFPAHLQRAGREGRDEVAILELVTPESHAFGTYAVRRRDSRRSPAARRFWAYACEHGARDAR